MPLQFRILIKGGTVVDGTGAPAFNSDVRVADGKIVEIGENLAPTSGERLIDAKGCYVTPGFIETHNHWDGGVWWSPNMEPCSAYGITTSINGNCRFSMAPAPQTEVDKRDVIDIFNFFEDIPEEPMKKLVPWDWRTWSEYKRSMRNHVRVPVNYAAFCGHIAIRLTVMGQEAWKRAATSAEIAEMAALLDDALAAGAMGLSSNYLDYDKHERPLPSQLADDAEFAALLGVVAKYPGSTFQVIVDNFMRMTGPETVERMGRLAKQAQVRMQWVGLPTLKFQATVRERCAELHEQFKAEGLDFWTGYHHVSPTSVINFGRTLVFAQNGNPVWQEVVDLPTWEQKQALLTDEAWLKRARDAWDQIPDHSYLLQADALFLRESETGYGPTGITMAEYMEQTGIKHISDAMATWVLHNGAESVIGKKSWERDEAVLLKLLRDPRSVGNISDAGAHGKLFCGAGDNIYLLTDFVRDQGLLTIEEGVHVMTGKLANFFGLHDRGVIQVGKMADIAVFNLAEVERRAEEKIWDVWDGKGGRTYRYTRAAAPMRLTLVNGEPTFDNGSFTGRFSGEFIGPTTVEDLATAAE